MTSDCVGEEQKGQLKFRANEHIFYCIDVHRNWETAVTDWQQMKMV